MVDPTEEEIGQEEERESSNGKHLLVVVIVGTVVRPFFFFDYFIQGIFLSFLSPSFCYTPQHWWYRKEKRQKHFRILQLGSIGFFRRAVGVVPSCSDRRLAPDSFPIAKRSLIFISNYPSRPTVLLSQATATNEKYGFYQNLPLAIGSNCIDYCCHICVELSRPRQAKLASDIIITLSYFISKLLLGRMLFLGSPSE